MRLEQVDKSFPHPGGSIRVLTGVSARFEPAESVAIIGPSGSGKSTLLSLMAGLDRPDSGRMDCLGEDLAAMTEKQLTAFRSKNISIVFQQFRLMPHMTAVENVRLPLDLTDLSGLKTPAAEARTALERVGLAHRFDHYPRQLSGGECQRVAIARALVTRPKILLADEPSGNLDISTGEKVMDLLFDLVRERQTTLILVTHDSKLADRCARKYVLNKGRLDAAQTD